MPPRLPVLALTCVMTLSAAAQSTEIGYVPRPNLVKVGLTSSVARTLSLNYERVLNDKLSVALTMSYMFPLHPPALFTLETSNITFGSDRRLTGCYLTPEVKWFVETSDPRPAPRGLYVGAYLRLSSTTYTSSFSATGSGSDAAGSSNSNMRRVLDELGAGPSAGYQFLALKDRLVFDCIFFAPRYCYYRLDVDADLNGNGQLYSDLAEAIEDQLGQGVLPLDVSLGRERRSTLYRHSLGYRYGIKIGYAF